MLFARETPSSVLYDDLHHFGGMSNVDAARVLLSARVGPGGTSPRDRVTSRTFLSRNVVHANPDDVNPAMFADFDVSAQTICSCVLRRHGNDRAALVEHYAGDAATRMEGALKSCGRDSQVYANEVARLSCVRLRSEPDRCALLLFLFCACGCLADASHAASLVEEFARRRLAQDISTVQDSVETAGSLAELADASQLGPRSLGLLRMIDGVGRPPILALEPSGSLVGSLAQGPGAVNDVEPDVSRQHLRIWREGERWLCQGLHSTNGTSIVSGADGEVISVEPPRSRQNAKFDYPPQELREGDTLCLGKSTRFLVMRIQHNG